MDERLRRAAKRASTEAGADVRSGLSKELCRAGIPPSLQRLDRWDANFGVRVAGDDQRRFERAAEAARYLRWAITGEVDDPEAWVTKAISIINRTRSGEPRYWWRRFTQRDKDALVSLSRIANLVLQDLGLPPQSCSG